MATGITPQRTYDVGDFKVTVGGDPMHLPQPIAIDGSPVGVATCTYAVLNHRWWRAESTVPGIDCRAGDTTLKGAAIRLAHRIDKALADFEATYEPAPGSIVCGDDAAWVAS